MFINPDIAKKHNTCKVLHPKMEFCIFVKCDFSETLPYVIAGLYMHWWVRIKENQGPPWEVPLSTYNRVVQISLYLIAK